MNRIKNFFATNVKSLVGSFSAAAATGLMVVNSFAGETTSADVSTALQNGLNSALADFMGYVALVLPLGLTIFGCVFGVKKGIAFFKTIAN